MTALTRREVDDGMRATLRFLSKADFSPFFRYWLKQSKEGFNPHNEDFEAIESQIDEETFRFRLGRGCQ